MLLEIVDEIRYIFLVAMLFKNVVYPTSIIW